MKYPFKDKDIDHNKLEECVKKSHLSLLKDDYDSTSDYTLCVAYQRYGLPVNWNEEYLDTTTEGHTSDTTTEGYTTDKARFFQDFFEDFYESTSTTTTSTTTTTTTTTTRKKPLGRKNTENITNKFQVGMPRMPAGLHCRRQEKHQPLTNKGARIVGGGIASRSAWNFITKIKICMVIERKQG